MTEKLVVYYEWTILNSCLKSQDNFYVKMWKYVLFKLVLWSYRFLNVITSFVFSFSLFSGHSRERTDMSENYERSAHVLKVKWKLRKFELEGPILQKHFLLRYSLRKIEFSLSFYIKIGWNQFKSESRGVYQIANTANENISWKQFGVWFHEFFAMKKFTHSQPYFPDMLGTPIQRLSWHQMLHSWT